MARVELIMPKMGESVSEATVICWKKEVGEMVHQINLENHPLMEVLLV